MKTLALVAILKNERHNLPQFLASFKGCVDHVYLCDTGSTDGSVEWIEKEAASVVGCPVSLSHFKWINDFAAARNFAKSNVKEDYWMWSDLDDVLARPEFFQAWRKNAMGLADMWYAPYHYGFDDKGVAVCKFIRERVMRTDRGYDFSDFVHEGVKPKEGLLAQATSSWWIDHKRTTAEMEADRSRNLDILKDKYNQLTPRLHAYLGKEFHDNGKHAEAVEELEKVVKYPESVLDRDDRIMALQFLALSHFLMGRQDLCIKIAQIGTHLDPLRAEFYCMIGDSYFSTGALHQAIPWYRAATGCYNQAAGGMAKLFSFDEMYSEYPRRQLAKIYFNIGEYDIARMEAEGMEHPEAKDVLMRIDSLPKSQASGQVLDCDDIVFTCLASAYPWDGQVYREKGIGGSETACVEMAENLAKLTGRMIKVFNEREEPLNLNGVDYLPKTHLADYFAKWKPKVHIAWRHNHKVTDAKTYVWSHDLMTPGAEHESNYEKLICLSEFHKGYVQGIQGVSGEKIWISRNGIRPERFDHLKMPVKQYGKVIWPNSPDRGLDYAMLVMDKVREVIPGAELHVFYGLENLRKYGMDELAVKLEAMMKERPWVKYHGNVDQVTLADEMASSEVWLYTANFIETFCITALEALACKTYPIARKMGALQNTLADAAAGGMAYLRDRETGPDDIADWASDVVTAIELKNYQEIDYDIQKHSWKSVAEDWVKEMDL